MLLFCSMAIAFLLRIQVLARAPQRLAALLLNSQEFQLPYFKYLFQILIKMSYFGANLKSDNAGGGGLFGGGS